MKNVMLVRNFTTTPKNNMIHNICIVRVSVVELYAYMYNKEVIKRFKYA